MTVNPVGLDGWGAIGVLGALAIIAGAILLVVYAVRRGLTHRDLDGTIPDDGATGTMPASAGAAAAPSRTLGLAGVTLLVAGLVLAVLWAVAGSGGPGASGMAPGASPNDCAQSWPGCPQATPNP